VDQFPGARSLFVAGGAFAGMEDLRKDKIVSSIGFVSSNKKTDVTPLSSALAEYGFSPELIGRFETVIEMKKLNKDELIEIIRNPNTGLIAEFQEAFRRQGIKLIFDDAVCQVIAQKALERNTGARGLKGVISELLTMQMYDSFGNPDAPKEVLITEKDIPAVENI